MTVCYPNKKLMNYNNKLSLNNNFFKRGISLEEMINETNKYYLTHNIACIHKKPTPIQVVSVDYKKRSTAKITEAYYTKPSTTDYNGIYKGFYIDFEAKQTKLKSLPIHNLHQHQIQHMNNVIFHGGICFFLVYFTSEDIIFMINSKYIVDFYNKSIKLIKKKPIEKEFLKKYGFEIRHNSLPLIDYIKIIDEHFLESEILNEK